MPALVSLCSQSHTKGAPQPGDTEVFKKRREKPRLARISGSKGSFCPKHRDRPPLSAALAVAHFPFVFGRTGSSAPRRQSWDTRKSYCSAPVAGHPPLASSLATSVPAALSPCPGSPPALAFSWVAVTRRLCCETKSDPLAPRQGRKPGLLTPQPHPGQEGGDPEPGQQWRGRCGRGPDFGAIAPSRTPVRLRL